MADSSTAVLNLVKPEVGGSNNTWGAKLDANWDAVDALFNASTGHNHNGSGTNGTPIPPLGLHGVATTNVGFAAMVSDTAFTPRVMAVLANGGLAVTNGNGVSGAPTFAVDPTNATALAIVADADIVLYRSVSASALRSATRAQFLTGVKIPGVSYLSTALGGVSGSVSLDCQGGSSVFSMTPTGTTTLAPINPPAAGSFAILVVYVTNGGAVTFNHPTGTIAPGNIFPTLSTSGLDKLVYSKNNAGAWDLSWQLDLRNA